MDAILRQVKFAVAVLLALVIAPNALAAYFSPVSNLQTGMCIAPTSTASGAAISQQGCAVTNTQMWRAEYVTVGFQNYYFRLRNIQTNLCLDLASASTGNGVGMVQRACSGAHTQQWKENGYNFHSKLTNRFSGKCLSSAGSGLVQSNCTNDPSHLWSIML